VPVFCIGNSGPGAATTRVPASYENALGVGATTSADGIASFSSRGPSPAGPSFPIDQRKPDLGAPGQLVRSSIPGGGYASWNGTSMAAPHVAGTVALMLEANPSLDVDAIRSQLLGSAADLGTAGYDYDFGYGRLDAFAATTLAVTAVGSLADGAGSGLRFAPNPFHNRLRIDYAVADGPASIAVFDLTGRQVWSAVAAGGPGTLTWDGRGRDGELLPSGVYLVRLRDGRSERTGRVLQLR
jgi:subtilisin family serine protease